MTAAVDANVLLYASDERSHVHREAQAFVEAIATGPEIWYLFWPVAVAYLRIATHPAIFDAPLPPAVAMANVGALLDRPHVRSPGEVPAFWPTLQAAVGSGRARGNLMSDAHLVALMRSHGVKTIWTRDRDFRRFDGIEVLDPFG